MSLEEFLKDCKKTGHIPVSYKSTIHTLKGKKTVEYVNPKYAHLARKDNVSLQDQARPEEKVGRAGLEGQAGYVDIGESISKMKGQDVVVHSSDGYHYGRLRDYDGKSFVFDRYYFDKNQLDYFRYLDKAFFNKESVVPAKGIISIGKIPMHVDY